MAKERIQKALAAAGVASRRAIEELVVQGAITVNGKLVTELPCFVDLDTDEIRVDGRRIRPPSREKVYFLLNKPRGVVCTMSDPQKRPRAIDLIPEIPERLYTVGRLDVESTGLILLTNDGELTERLTHPRYGVMKRYVVRVQGKIAGEDIETLKAGELYLEGKRVQRSTVRVLRRNPEETLLEVGLSEGLNREVRRLLARLGYKVRRLHRRAIGPITDDGLKIGSFRMLHPREVKALREATEPGGTGEGSAPAGRRSKPMVKRTGPPKRTGESGGPKKAGPSSGGGRKAPPAGGPKKAPPTGGSKKPRPTGGAPKRTPKRSGPPSGPPRRGGPGRPKRG